LYYWPSTATDASGLCTAGPPGSDFDGANPWKCTPTAGAPVYYETIGFGPNFGCPQAQLNTMDNSSPDLIGTIGNMTAFGDKVIPLGMAWSFRLLSSAWQNQWSDALDNFNYTDLRAFANNVSFHSHILKRIVILVTDGEDSVAAGDYTAYGLPPAPADLDTRTATVCANMKADGITIYVVGLGPLDATATALLSGCATDAQHFFPVTTTAGLQAAFKNIANDFLALQRPHLVQ
jgi:hypothetical protein